MPAKSPAQSASKSSPTLTVRDNRTGKEVTIDIAKNAIPATAFKQLAVSKEDQVKRWGGREEDEPEAGLRVYDPAYSNTSVIESQITYIDGESGILRYRGYPIEELAEKSTYLEVAYLLIYGSLPTSEQLASWQYEVEHHTFVHSDVEQLVKCFRYDAHPMSILISSIASLSAFAPEANPALAGQNLYTKDNDAMNKQIFRIMGKVISLAAQAYRIRIGRPPVAPKSGLPYTGGLSYTANFFYMMDHLGEADYTPNPVLVKAMDRLFILMADHEMNCSTATMLHVGSSLVDPYSAVAASAAALYGSLHGGANSAVVYQLEKIASPDNVPGFIAKVKAGEEKLMGFGHRVYKSMDPRGKIIRQIADEVFAVVGRDPLIDTAVALHEAASKDEYFTKRKLYANVDFWSGIIYKAMGFPVDMFTVLFALPRTSGWLAHWKQAMQQKGQRIWRPRQLYVGSGLRNYVPIESRKPEADSENPTRQVRKSKLTTGTTKRTQVADYRGKHASKGNAPEKAKL